MKPLDFFGRYFWLLCIVAVAVNYLFADFFSRNDGAVVDRELRRKYQGWLAIASIIPWAVVGYGQLVGGIRSVWALFRPQDLNPYVWSFYASCFLLYLAGAWWVFFHDGARIASDLRLMKYHVMGKSGAMSPFWIKVMTAASFPFFALWLWLAWHMNVPVQ